MYFEYKEKLRSKLFYKKNKKFKSVFKVNLVNLPSITENIKLLISLS